MSNWTKHEIETAAWLCKIAYENDDAVREMLLKQRQWRLVASIYDDRTDTHAFFAQNDGLQVQAIAFRGTESKTDLLHDLNAIPEHALGGTVHNGFWLSYKSVAKTIQDLLSNNPLPTAEQNRMSPTALRSGGIRLLITGHSLGAALATLAAGDLSFSLVAPRMGVITFGGPRVGFKDFISLFEDRMGQRYVRVVYLDDPITQVPVSPYKHTGGLLHLDASGNDIGAIRRGIMFAWSWLKSIFRLGKNLARWEDITNHSLHYYQAAINQMNTSWERPIE